MLIKLTRCNVNITVVEFTRDLLKGRLILTGVSRVGYYVLVGLRVEDVEQWD